MPQNPILPASSFATLRQEGGCYIDKTGCLGQLLQTQAPVTLFMRPPGFGKTLFLSTLAEFFDIGKDSRALFRGLAVAADQELCEIWMNRFPVLFLSLQEVAAADYQTARARMRRLITDLCARHTALLGSNGPGGSGHPLIGLLAREKEDDQLLDEALLILTQALHRHHGQPVVVLADDLDAPLAAAARHGYLKEMLAFVRRFFSAAFAPGQETSQSLPATAPLQAGPSCKLGIFTGCLPVFLSSRLNSPLGNMAFNNITSPAFADAFGLTDDEVAALLERCGLADRHKAVKTWCGGYRFGAGQVMYRPGRVLQFVENSLCPPDKSPSSACLQEQDCPRTGQEAEDLLAGFGDKVPPAVEDKMACLLEGGSIAVQVDEFLGYAGLYGDEDAFWSWLFMTGLLAPADGSTGADAAGHTLLAIPNTDARHLFEKTLAKRVRTLFSLDAEDEFFQTLWKAKAKDFGYALLHLTRKLDEYDYHIEFFCTALRLLFAGTYRTTSVRLVTGPEGQGIVALAACRKRAAVLLVRFVPKDRYTLENVDAGLSEIVANRYDAPLREAGYSEVLHWSALVLIPKGSTWPRVEQFDYSRSEAGEIVENHGTIVINIG